MGIEERDQTMRGVFICVEGIDGSGKTTQAHQLVKFLVERGYDAVYTTEPTRSVFGKMIRENILQREKRVPPLVEAIMFAIDRFDHVQKVMKPLLEAGKIVVCDRYVYSSIAYQGASDLNREWIERINRFAMKPDLAVYLDVQPEIVLNRIRRRKTVMENHPTQELVRRLYMKLVEEERLTMINGNASKAEVAAALEEIVLRFLRDLRQNKLD